MALGKFADTNLALTAALTGGTWSAALPLANLLDDKRYIGAPARCSNAALLANSQFIATLATTRMISLVYLMFTTLSISARWRISIIGPGGSWAAPDYVGAWTPAYGAVFQSYDQEYELENWWTGQLPSSQIDLFPRHVFQVLTPTLASAVKVEIDDVSNASGTFDIGGLFIGGAWSPSVNYERGMELAFEGRDIADEAPSGRLFTEARTGRRTVAVTYEALTTDEARAWFDAGVRAQGGKTVIFIPDADDEPGRIRGAFPAIFGKPPAPRFTYPTQNQVAATFREIIA